MQCVLAVGATSRPVPTRRDYFAPRLAKAIDSLVRKKVLARVGRLAGIGELPQFRDALSLEPGTDVSGETAVVVKPVALGAAARSTLP